MIVQRALYARIGIRRTRSNHHFSRPRNQVRPSESDSRRVNVIRVLQRSGQRKSCVSIGRKDQDNTVCGNTFADFQKSIFARNPKAVRSSDGTYLSSLFRATQSLSRAESLYFSGRIFKAATTFSNELAEKISGPIASGFVKFGFPRRIAIRHFTDSLDRGDFATGRGRHTAAHLESQLSLRTRSVRVKRILQNTRPRRRPNCSTPDSEG